MPCVFCKDRPRVHANGLCDDCYARRKALKVVYIAGPFRGPNAWVIEQNVRKAEGYAFEVGEAGFFFLCPHTNTRFFHGTLTDEFWLELTMELMRRCDGVLFIPGWQKSSGCRDEFEEARKLELPIFYSVDEIKEYVNGR